MFTSLDVSTSGLVAQRTRLNAISSNIANMSTTRNEYGEPVPYQPRFVTFETDSKLGSPGGGAAGSMIAGPGSTFTVVGGVRITSDRPSWSRTWRTGSPKARCASPTRPTSPGRARPLSRRVRGRSRAASLPFPEKIKRCSIGK